MHNNNLLDKGVSNKSGCVGEERDDDDIDMAYAGGDGICSVQERDARQCPHGHGYSCTFAAVNRNVKDCVG